MVAASESQLRVAKWGDILERVADELELASRQHVWGELTLSVKFENGVPTAEKIGVVKSRPLKKL